MITIYKIYAVGIKRKIRKAYVILTRNNHQLFWS
jgi:hypothetical protein